MLGTVIMRKKRTAVCSRFQSQFRPLTSEIGKAEQCPAMRKDHPVSDFKKKKYAKPMLPTAGHIHGLDSENNTALLFQKKKAKLRTSPPPGSEGRRRQGIDLEKEEGKLLAEKMQKYTSLLPDTGKKNGCRMHLWTYILLLAALPKPRENNQLERNKAERDGK